MKVKLTLKQYDVSLTEELVNAITLGKYLIACAPSIDFKKIMC